MRIHHRGLCIIAESQLLVFWVVGYMPEKSVSAFPGHACSSMPRRVLLYYTASSLPSRTPCASLTVHTHCKVYGFAIACDLFILSLLLSCHDCVPILYRLHSINPLSSH